MGGHPVSALAYVDDITLISLSMTVLRIIRSISEHYASEHDIMFNGSESQLMFFKGRCCNVSTLSVVVCCQLIKISDSAFYLGHTITSTTELNSLYQLHPVFGKV